MATEVGFKIQIHDQREPPLITEMGFGVSPGFQTLVTAKEQRLSFLPEPWGKCMPVDEPIGRVLQNKTSNEINKERKGKKILTFLVGLILCCYRWIRHRIS